MYQFCTITTVDYLPFVQSLFVSLKKQNQDVHLHVLVLENSFQGTDANINFYIPNQIEPANSFIAKFHARPDKLRWALKPVFLSHLLSKLDTVIYVDNDIYFFNQFDFLFKSLEQHSLLLTPHWTCFEPVAYPYNFISSFQIGLFNAGFIGASRKGLATLDWWAQLCLYRMERDIPEGFFDDQRYLDLAFIVDENVGIIRHAGCNVGSWNIHQNKRTYRNGEVLINNKYPIVFIHFNNETIKHILNGNDAKLKPYYDQYEQTFRSTGHVLMDFKHHDTVKGFKKIKHRIRVRTRIKNFLLHLSQKL